MNVSFVIYVWLLLLIKVRPSTNTSNVADAIGDLVKKGDARRATTTAISYLPGSNDSQVSVSWIIILTEHVT